jgi:hypothetical protein
MGHLACKAGRHQCWDLARFAKHVLASWHGGQSALLLVLVHTALALDASYGELQKMERLLGCILTASSKVRQLQLHSTGMEVHWYAASMVDDRYGKSSKRYISETQMQLKVTLLNITAEALHQ